VLQIIVGWLHCLKEFSGYMHRGNLWLSQNSSQAKDAYSVCVMLHGKVVKLFCTKVQMEVQPCWPRYHSKPTPTCERQKELATRVALEVLHLHHTILLRALLHSVFDKALVMRQVPRMIMSTEVLFLGFGIAIWPENRLSSVQVHFLER
jgi:hypothetical protein